MDNPDKIIPLKSNDRHLLSEQACIFDLGTKTIIGQDEDEVTVDLVDLTSKSI